MKRLVPTVLLGLVASAALFLAGSAALQAQSADSEKVATLFNQMRQHVALAERDAEVLETYTRSRVSWESHARRVSAMKDHVNALIGDYNEAKGLHDEASPWQKEALDRLEPLLQGLAQHLSASIDHLNKNQGKVNLKPWQDYIKANYQYTVRTSNLIRDFMDYGDAKNTVETLEQKLELPETPGQE
ncbi:MAG: hypothetical protein ACLGSD_15690 [Acidobacteriota bacterium]